MTRTEVLTRFSINADGEITTPGVWEGEPVYASYFYDAYKLGRKAEETQHRRGVLSAAYRVTPEDKLAFPELAEAVYVTLFVDEERALEFMHVETSFYRGGRAPNRPYEEDDEVPAP